MARELRQRQTNEERDEAAERAERRKAVRARQMRADLKTVLGTKQGRRVLWDLIDDQTNVHGGSFAGENTHETAYHEGRRSVGIDLLERLQAAEPESYLVMVREALQRRRDEVAEDAEDRSDEDE